MKKQNIILLIAFIVGATILIWKFVFPSKFVVLGNPELLKETCILIKDEDIDCFKYVCGEERFSINRKGAYVIFVSYKDSLYSYSYCRESPVYAKHYRKKKVEIEKIDGVMYVNWLIEKEQEGRFDSYKLKPMNELLKDSTKSNSGWATYTKSVFTLLGIDRKNKLLLEQEYIPEEQE